MLRAQSHPTLCDFMDRSQSGSTVYGIFQVRTLQWVAISCSKGSFRPRDLTCVSWRVDTRPLRHLGSQYGNITRKKKKNTPVLFPFWASLVAQTVKNPPAMRDTWVRSLNWEDPPGGGHGKSTPVFFLLLLSRFSRVRLCVTP